MKKIKLKGWDWLAPVKKLVVIIVIVFLLIFFAPNALKLLKSQFWSIEKQEEERKKDLHFKDATDPQTLEHKFDVYLSELSPDNKQHTDGELKQATKDIIFALGVNDYELNPWNPFNWIEDEYRAYNIVVEFKYEYEILRELYYIGTRKRDLDSDLTRYLYAWMVTELREDYNLFA